MTITAFSTIFNIITAAIYLIVAVFAVRKRGFGDAVTRLLVFYSVMAILWEGIRASFTYLYFRLALPESVLLHLPYYGLFLLAYLYWALTISFLQGRAPNWSFWLFAPFWLGVVLALDFNWFRLPDVLWQNAAFLIDRNSISFVTIVIGWGLCQYWTARTTTKSYRTSERIVVKHRITYWALSVVLTFGGGVLFLVFSGILSSGFYVLGAITAFYIITVQRLPDLNQTLKRILSALLIGLLELVIFAAGFWVIQNYFAEFVGYRPLLAGFILALVLLVLFNPLLRMIQKWVNRLIVGSDTDTNRIFREYSQSISNILDLNLLSTVAVGLIRDVLDVKNGVLFSVDAEFGEDGERHYRLKGIQGVDGSPPVNAVIPIESPIAKQLGDERLPLMQSEIDVLPEFRYLTAQERSWLNSQEMDVYVPIHAKDEWVGVFALGPKRSGASFFDDDIGLLTTLANQTAVALENARLVGSLVRINNEFRRAYSSMEEAHSKLEKIDRTKSDFISIASHELRTPLTVLSGYSQMLMDDPTFSENAYYAKIISGIYDGTSRLHEIVDSMLDVAKIDTRALELQSEPINLNSILNTTCQNFSKAFKERDLTLDFDGIGSLPAVQGDPEALKKVFYHLVMNAIKYTPDGGKITVSGYTIGEGDDRFPSGGVEIVVSDTGIGIDPRFKDLIFTKFYQTGELALHSSGKVKFKGGGPGLGLAIVRGIIQAHGGRVWADSPGYDEERNPGSHFHVVIPLNADKKVIPPGEINV
jgi:signal transduction histidine kinase